MNKSYSKIRHIQESNQRLESRLLKEQSDTKQTGFEKGFEKFPCIMKIIHGQGYDTNHDGIIDVVGMANKQYYPDGTVKFNDVMGQHGKDFTQTVKSTYFCQGDKIIDNFTKNPKGKVYSNNNPWVESNNQTIIPWFTKDPVGSNWVAKLQQKLIDGGFLRIKKTTGYLGNMTQTAIHQAAVTYSPEENNPKGITKKLYDRLVNGQKNTTSFS